MRNSRHNIKGYQKVNAGFMFYRPAQYLNAGMGKFGNVKGLRAESDQLLSQAQTKDQFVANLDSCVGI